MKDAHDISNYGCTQTNELLYEGEGLGHGVINTLFSKLIWGGSNDILYSYECFASKNLFGCAGLKRAENCILNKQYAAEEYEEFAGKIIEHMKTTGEWGEFFPAKYSPFGYNETVAMDLHPLSQEEAQKRGFKWTKEVDDIPKVEKVIPADKLPDSLHDIPDDVLNWAITCESTGRPFVINRRELDFYRKMKVPLTHHHPDERHCRLMRMINPLELHNRQCAKCSAEIQTTYAPERPEIVYCEKCYLQEVY
jgi:hypothetical protein